MPPAREPYSVRRRQQENPDGPVVYEYSKASKLLRAQLMYGLRLAMRAPLTGGEIETYWASIEASIAAERGIITGHLSDWNSMLAMRPEDRIADYIGRVRNIDYLLDAIETAVTFAYNAADAHRTKTERQRARKFVEEGVEEINYRFRFHAVGYQYVGSPGEIIRLDSQYVHVEIVEPALSLIQAAGWKGPEDEFLSAHKHYRRGEYKAAMNDALKAFESTMKAILTEREWEFDPNGSSYHLIGVLTQKGLIPGPLEAYMKAIRSVLADGVPTLRNRLSGHGQGANITKVPDHVAAFTLNLTASNIVFLTEANAAYVEKT